MRQPRDRDIQAAANRGRPDERHANRAAVVVAAQTLTHLNCADAQRTCGSGTLRRRCRHRRAGYKRRKNRGGPCRTGHGGDVGARTPDPLLAKQVLYQLSYIPTGRGVVRFAALASCRPGARSGSTRSLALAAAPSQPRTANEKGPTEGRKPWPLSGLAVGPALRGAGSLSTRYEGVHTCVLAFFVRAPHLPRACCSRRVPAVPRQSPAPRQSRRRWRTTSRT